MRFMGCSTLPRGIALSLSSFIVVEARPVTSLSFGRKSNLPIAIFRPFNTLKPHNPADREPCHVRPHMMETSLSEFVAIWNCQRDKDNKQAGRARSDFSALHPFWRALFQECCDSFDAICRGARASVQLTGVVQSFIQIG